MFHKNRSAQFLHYNNARRYFLSHPERIVQLEKYLSDEIEQLLTDNLDEVVTDYNEASYIFPFWQNYPPRERGRKPIGDQFPWIEVGEHVVGRKLARWLPRTFRVRDTGSPTGPDERFLLSSPEVKEILEITDSTWLFLDIKSVGPRDDADHAVLSHNQVSGSGTWTVEEEGVRNGILTAVGARASHQFHCALPPMYVLSDNTVAPVVHVVVKLVYRMLPSSSGGQPLSRITLASLPNGLLLTVFPNYLAKYPNLLFPGKDDKSKAPETLRARVSFPILRLIDNWRVRDITIQYSSCP